MSCIVITIFYVYFIFSVRYYRKELMLRSADNISKRKAPYSIRFTVLFCIFILVFNSIVQLLFTDDALIMLHTLPIIICTVRLRIFRRKLSMIDFKK